MTMMMMFVHRGTQPSVTVNDDNDDDDNVKIGFLIVGFFIFFLFDDKAGEMEYTFRLT